MPLFAGLSIQFLALQGGPSLARAYHDRRVRIVKWLPGNVNTFYTDTESACLSNRICKYDRDADGHPGGDDIICRSGRSADRPECSIVACTREPCARI